MAGIQQVGKALGRDHALAEALWETGVYEARMLAAFVDDPALVTPEQMDRWTRDFDNWADLRHALLQAVRPDRRTPSRWSTAGRTIPAEFVKRTAFALLASLALHDKKSGDEPFLARLPLIEAAATDERNFVKKGVSWALRAIGGRKSPALRAAARETGGPAGRFVRQELRDGSARTRRRTSPRQRQRAS